jgi:hypothetical protein
MFLKKSKTKSIVNKKLYSRVYNYFPLFVRRRHGAGLCSGIGSIYVIQRNSFCAAARAAPRRRPSVDIGAISLFHKMYLSTFWQNIMLCVGWVGKKGKDWRRATIKNECAACNPEFFLRCCHRAGRMNVEDACVIYPDIPAFLPFLPSFFLVSCGLRGKHLSISFQHLD